MACAAESHFMFVEYSAPAPAVKGKKRRGSPSDVRAHITKEFHRRLRVKRTKQVDALRGHASLPMRGKTSVPSPKTAKRPVPSSEKPKTSNPPEEVEDVQAVRHETYSPSTQSSTNLSRIKSLNEEISLRFNLTRRLTTTLGEGRVDPFDVLPSRAPLFLHQVLDHALVHTWPNTVPVRNRVMTNPINSAWMKCAMEWPVAFHAFIYSIALHLLSVYNGRELTESAPVMRLAHKLETIKLVNEQLRNLSGPPSDALIMAVTILAVHGERDATVYPRIHPTSPMASVQDIHVYGNMINDETHVQAIVLLIKQKGGLDGIELYGMAEALALCDLYFATKHVQAPYFAWRRQPESLVTSGKHLLDATAVELYSKLGSGFKYFGLTLSGRELLEVLESFCEVTIALDQYVREGKNAPQAFDLVEARNSTQHRLLSQISPQLDLGDAEKCIHHSCRLATLIFSDMVLFPLPPTQRLKPRLALMLHHTLEAGKLLSGWELHSQMYLWMLTLGAISASFTTERIWYINELLQLVEALGIQEWSTLESICYKFLWWKPVCNEPGQRLWTEMVTYPTVHKT